MILENVIHLFYNVFVVPILYILYAVGAIFNRKIRDRLVNEKQIVNNISTTDQAVPCILIHASSVGEFEQCKPLIERLRNDSQSIKFIVSFSSPSAFNSQKNYPYVNSFVYLPFDSPSRVKAFINIVKPDVIIIDRYDVWWNFVKECYKRNIPIHLINATYPSSKFWRLPLLQSYIKILYHKLDTITPITSEHQRLFAQLLHPKRVYPALPDTRFDRINDVIQSKSNSDLFNRVRDNFKDSDSNVVVIGSSWKEDEDIILPNIQRLQNEYSTLSFVIVPHEPNVDTIERLLSVLPNSIRLSQITANSTSSVVIVDSVGLLLSMYSIAIAAYVGGGFGAGVHSVAEAAGYGIPIACGSNISRNQSAIELLNLGGLRICTTENEFYSWITQVVLQADKQQSTGLLNKSYVLNQTGTASKLVDMIFKK